MKESNNRIEEIKNDHAGFIDDKFHKGESVKFSNIDYILEM